MQFCRLEYQVGGKNADQMEFIIESITYTEFSS